MYIQIILKIAFNFVEKSLILIGIPFFKAIINVKIFATRVKCCFFLNDNNHGF